jgi:hypothetical protein
MVSLSERVQSFTNLVNGATWYIKRNLTGRVMLLLSIFLMKMVIVIVILVMKKTPINLVVICGDSHDLHRTTLVAQHGCRQGPCDLKVPA